MARGPSSDLPETIIMVVLLFAILFTGVSVVSGVADVTVGDSSGNERETVRDDRLVSGDTATVDGTNVSVIGVSQSLNDSARLDGSGSLSGSLGSDVATNRTVSSWAYIENTSRTQLVVSIDSRTQLVHNGTSGEWACWSYSDSTDETHRVAVNTSTPSNWTNLQCERANGRLEIRRNDTEAANSVQLDSANATSQTLQTEPLEGRIDETRVYNGSLSAAEHGTLVAAPTAPLDVSNRVARIYYDSYGGLGTIPVYISGGSLDGSAATKANGLAGQGAAEGTDYLITGDTITTLDGGTLDGAPVLFAVWTRAAPGPLSATVALVTSQYAAAIVLAGLVPIIVLVGFVMTIMRSQR